MPDIFDIFNQMANKGEETTPSQAPLEDQQSHDEYLDPRYQPKPEQPKNTVHQLPNASNDPAEQEQRKNEAYAAQRLDPISAKNSMPSEEDPDSWSPEYTMRPFLEETGVSFARGFGKHVVGGTGDMLQVGLALLPGVDVSTGNIFSRFLQEEGAEIAENFKAWVPEELQHENLNFSSALKPEFWSKQVAEYIPQLVEFILLSKGGAALARGAANAAVKGAVKKGVVKGATKTALGDEIFNSGSKIVGKMINDQGMRKGTSMLVSAMGGGYTSNKLSGMLNAAQVVNKYKDVKGPDGQPLYDEEALSNLAASTMRNNSAYMLIDMASYGMTFGGGWKGVSKLLGKSTAPLKTAIQQNKIASKMFQYDMSPIVKSLGKLTGKAGFEGVEESFQETFEEWAVKKAEAEMTGDGSTDLLDVDSFWDFYTSKENRGTVVISAALGALGGAGFNATDLINKKADEHYRLHDAVKNFTEITKKSGTEEENTAQEMFTRRTIANMVIDENRTADDFKNFMDSLEDNENIDGEERKRFEEMYKHFEETAKKAKKLNVVGMKALLQNKADETYAAAQMQMFEEESKERIATYQAMEVEFKNDPRKRMLARKKVQEEQAAFKDKIDAMSLIHAAAIQNQENLILGEKANPINMQTRLDRFGNKIMTGGLTDQQYKEFTIKGEGEKTPSRFKMPGLSSLSKRARELFEKAKAPFMKEEQSAEETAAEETASEESVALSPEEKKSIEDEFGVTVEEGTNAVQAPEGADPSIVSKAEAKIKETLAAKQAEPEAEKEEQTDEEIDAEVESQMKEVKIDENGKEPIDDETYKAFVKSGEATPETIEDIAKAIADGKKISNRQEHIRLKSEEAVRQKVKDIILGIKPPVEPEVADEMIEDEVEDEVDNIEDDNLTEQEKGYVAKKVVSERKGVPVGQDARNKKDAAKKGWNFDKKKTKGSEDKLGHDARQKENPFNKLLVRRNLALANATKNFLQKFSWAKITNGEHVSKNELDNYLNTYSIYNRVGPTNVDKMIAVNHQLKRMFPNIEDRPAQTIIVRNLFEAVGSEGLGYAMGATIFIDENAWDQDWVFMHELSHIYFKLARHTPEVEAIVKMALADANLIKEIKSKYDDYTLYGVENEDGSIETFRKSQVFQILAQNGIEPDMYEAQLANAIAAGELTTIPMKQQEHLINEMFARVLQGPLSDNMDKIFRDKERKRQKDVKAFWGLMRKRGKVIESENGVEQMLRKLGDEGEVREGTLKDFMLAKFKAVTEGIQVDGFGMDARVEKINAERQRLLDDVARRKAETISSTPKEVDDDRTIEDYLDEYENDLEETGSPFTAKEFRQQRKKATKIIKRFGIVFNKAKRQQAIRANKHKDTDWAKQDIFDREMFESVMYNLGVENESANGFIVDIENSALEEVQDFNDYLNEVYPDTKLEILTSMHFVFSNAKHVSGFRNLIKADGTYDYVNSLSHAELNITDRVLGRLNGNYQAGNEEWQEFSEAVANIRNGQETSADYLTVLDALTDYTFRIDKVLEQGYITYQGINIPIETLISGFIKKGMMQNRSQDGQINWNSLYVYNARPLVEALVNTNRKFSPHSIVLNADGNMEQARIVNNHLTNEVDNMIKFLAPDNKGNRKTKDEFLNRFSHLGHKSKMKLGQTPISSKKMKDIYSFISPNGDKRIPSKSRTMEAFPTIPEPMIDRARKFLTTAKKGDRPSESEFLKAFDGQLFEMKENRAYVPNQFLEQIYDNYESGILPTISQYHGLQNGDNQRGSVFKDSTALEQGIEDFMIFVNSSRTESGKKNRQYLGSMGAFSDSPRKFFMNMKRIDFNDVFVKNGKNTQFHPDGKVLNSAFNLLQQIHPDHPSAASKGQFKKSIFASVKRNIEFFESNANELQKISKIRNYFDANGKLNKAGQEVVAEYTINSLIHKLNIDEVFIPGVKGGSIAKRFKANSSPVLSVKNPNFKTEFLFYADEIEDNDIAGTDSGMYILEEQAIKLQKLGQGVFDMNHGFKLLNSHVEKTNPNFKDKIGYLKGYTTIVKKGHPLYNAMKARVDKYNAYHKAKYGVDPSDDLSDGSHNHLLLAIPQSSDKSNFSGEEFIEEIKDENGNTVLRYTPDGERMTPTALSKDWEHINKIQDDLYYDGNGEFIGLETYNFGPQQVMDKVSNSSNTPVQFINNLIVNAKLNGQLDLAEQIQQHIANQKKQNLDKIIEDIKSGNISDYRKIIEDHLNKEDMDQAQRLIFEDNGSLANPFLNEIAVNQLAKTILRAGNKLQTPGTNAHQKPDIGYNLNSEINVSGKLKGYEENADGTLSAMEIVLPKHMNSKVKAREYITTETMKDQLARIQKSYGKRTFTKADALDALKSLATVKAKERAKRENNMSNWPSYLREHKNAQGVPIGYYVKGETVIASRVPGSKPGDTGVFEVVAFDNTEGNQVMVPAEFNRILGSDNDGDSLFIQTQGPAKKFGEWNKAFNLMTQYWLSKDMKDQIRTRMSFDKKAKAAVADVRLMFPQAGETFLPGSPEQRMKEYNDTMVAKRNVGPIFNLHKVANMLAAYEVELRNKISINGVAYNKFQDNVKGEDSRNQASAILANIILDNAKHGHADALGLDEYNTAQAAILTNLGVSLSDLGKILNSPAAKLLSELNRNNSSMFHAKKTPATINREVYQILQKAQSLYNNDQNKGSKTLTDYIPQARQGFKYSSTAKMPKAGTKGINVSQAGEFNQQLAILELFKDLGKINSDLQKVTGIMSGHNKIHVNPFVLEKQINDFKEALSSDKGPLVFNERFRKNPDMQQYLNVAEETLKHTQKLSPVYRTETKKVLADLAEKIGNDLTVTEIERITKDLLKFNTSRLLGLNNNSVEYTKDLMNPESENSIYKKLETYLQPLKTQYTLIEDGTGKKKVSKFHNSVLFRRALSMNLTGKRPYISASSSFVDESFNDVERKRIQDEFEEMPPALQDDLILYDLIKTGWKGHQSMLPFFGRETSSLINVESNMDNTNKGKIGKISKSVTDQLERIIALKHAAMDNNPFQKHWIKGDLKPTSQKAVVKEVLKNKAIVARIKADEEGKGMYINVKNKKLRSSALYEMEPFTGEELARIDAERTTAGKQNMKVQIAAEKLKLVNDVLAVPNPNKWWEKNPEINIALISDKGVQPPHKTRPNYDRKNNMDALTEAAIRYEDIQGQIKEGLRKGFGAPAGFAGFDAREDFDIPLFSKREFLKRYQFEQAMEYPKFTSQTVKDNLWKEYLKQKADANDLAKKELKGIKNKSREELMEMYERYGNKDVYAYSIILTPVVKQLASVLTADQAKLWKDNKVQGKGFDGVDISKIQAQLMTGSTIPSNHPAAQGMVRIMEKEYKNFLGERRKYMIEVNKVTDALYQEKLGYGAKRSLKTIFKKVRDTIFKGQADIYQRLYGNMVIREEKRDGDGNLTYDFKLRPVSEIERDFKDGKITKAEKDFYDLFRKTTAELKPKDMKAKTQADYIPHTSMNTLEAFSSRGLLGLMVNSRPEDEQIWDVKMKYVDPATGKEKLMNFKKITDLYKLQAAGEGKNDIRTMLEYRKLKKKALKLLEDGKNEDGSQIQYSTVQTETALGFGAINRFAHNRSVKAEELPSMDLNKALADYVHSTLFVNGNENFQGFKKLQGYIDGVIAFNRENNLENLNTHVQTVWKDYFLRGKRQESFMGKKADKVIRTLTRMNLFYALGWQANKNTMGLYALGNVLVGKYHNIKDIGGKAWINGELKFWGLENGFEGGISAVVERHKRMQRIMKNLNFMDINVYDEIDIDRKSGLDKVFSDIALMPMTASETWIQQVHMLGLLTDNELDQFDDQGNYKPDAVKISNDRLIQLEDQVKGQHGRGYQPTDQRAAQMYSWGNMMLQFSKFIPTMIQDRFAKQDVNIYGQEHIGSLRSVGKMVRYVYNNPKEYKKYRESLSPEMRRKLDSGLKGAAMSAVIGFAGAAFSSETANELYWDANYYFNHGKLEGKLIPPAIQSTNNLVGQLF